TAFEEMPVYHGEPYVVLKNNEPNFSETERQQKKAFETYSDLDSLGRPGVAFANICQELMPTEKRGEIGHIKPVGWNFAKYDIVDGKYLYNRCHLVGYQLAGENANEKNLMTGTRYMNVEGMEPFENMVADYVKDSGNHVLYRVTPVYQDANLLASGVQMEGYSVEDEGKGICFHVYVFNAQPGVEINYKSGESHLKDDYESTTETVTDMESENSEIQDYILNMNTKKFHRPFCDSVKDMKEKNKKPVKDYRENIMKEGYQPCKRCNP
ncbi:MAG: DNA/RNA non-specific endonuclease, partial [Eubacterium sp.]|nr:DNA/RNA non-specific endonuclease [Eubacterium sp.]